MTPEEAKALYKGKTFYETINGEEVGPLDDLFYISPEAPGYSEYKFCRVVDGIIVEVFKENEIIVKQEI